MQRNRTGSLVASVALILAAGVACSGGEGGGARSASRPAPSDEATTTTRPGQVAAPSTSLPHSADLGDALDAVDGARSHLPYPEDVLDCVAARAAADADLLTALKKPSEAANLEQAQIAASACVVEVRSAPRFAEDLQRAAGGTLTEEQVACATREFADLDPEAIEAAAGAVLNPEQADDGATAPVEEIYETCKIERGKHS